MECPKHLVGRVIGRGGETIQMLQAKTGARIQIDQNVADVRNHITKVITAIGYQIPAQILGGIEASPPG